MYHLIIIYSLDIVGSYLCLFVFRFLQFPREGKIVTIDKLEYCMSTTKVTTMGTTMSIVGDNPYENVCVVLLKILSLICVFVMSLPNIPNIIVGPMHMIYSVTSGSHESPNP